METVISPPWFFDGLLAVAVLTLAWQALRSPDLFRAVVLFIAFGLLMALVWVRLAAPDIALAEAAIGSGLSGALLLASVARLRTVEKRSDLAHAEDGLITHPDRWLPLLLLLPVVAGLTYVLLSLPSTTEGLSAAVNANLELSGVGNPVTAVLLNFRAYDTLLEVFVLLLALMGVWSLGAARIPIEAPGPVLEIFVRLLIPILILVAAYLLWVGADAPGGAFQAGATLAAAGVLLVLAAWPLEYALSPMQLRLLLIVGPAMFIVMSILTLVAEGGVLQFPPDMAGLLILMLESGATLSIAVTLIGLFGGARAHERERS